VGVAGWVPDGLVAVGTAVRSALRDGVGATRGACDVGAGAVGIGEVKGTVSTGTGPPVTTTVQLLVSMGWALRMSGPIEQPGVGQTWNTIVYVPAGVAGMVRTVMEDDHPVWAPQGTEKETER
jgi:hypothetical protein